MSAKTVVVAHRVTMMAEGIAAALGRFRGIIPVAVVTSASDAERRGGAADAVVLDQHLGGSAGAATRLRRSGVRVVMLGEGDDEDEDLRISPRSSIVSLAAAILPQALDKPPLPPLTARERQVLDLISHGLAGKQVARQLGISPKTVEQHKTRIYFKLGVRNQTAAVSMALGAGSQMTSMSRDPLVTHAPAPNEREIGDFPRYRDTTVTSTV